MGVDSRGSYHVKPGPMSREKIYQAQVVIALGINHDIQIMKNRYTYNTGSVDINIAIEVIADMLTRAKFDGSMKMFQEGMRLKLIEAMNDVLSDKNISLKGTENEIVQRESRGNGSRRNTILQRFISIRR